MNKELLLQRFRCATKTYNTHAVIQKKMAEELVSMAKECIPKLTGNMMELGCGTGLLTKEILKFFNPSSYVANDLVAEVKPLVSNIIKERSGFPFSFIQGDAEKMEYTNEQDVIWSGATIQWVKELDIFFSKIQSALISKGYFVFSSFDTDNFKEIKSITGSGIDYVPLPLLSDIAEQHFRICKSSTWEEKLWFNTPQDVLKHMRYTGVNAIAKNKWGKTDLECFVRSYESFKDNEGYPLTYNPILMVLQKK